MNYAKWHITLGYFLIWNFISAQPSTDQIGFRELTVEQGLSQNSVVSIAQDSIGYLWFATQDGLNKYNGKGFDYYNHQFVDITRPDYSKLGKVYVSRDGGVYCVNIDGELLKYSTSTDEFSKISEIENISTVLENSNGDFFIGTYGNGLFHIPEKSGDTIQLFEQAEDFRDIYNLKEYNNDIYIAATSGLYSAAFGEDTSAASRSSFILGRANVGLGSSGSWNPSDPVFEIGIGTVSTPDNAITVLKNGKTGLGTHTPRSVLEVSHITGTPSVSNFSNAFTIANETSKDSWQFYTQDDGYLLLFKDGNYRGSFNAASGVYGPVSDKNLKKNIRVLDDNDAQKLMALNPVKYQMIDQKNTKENYGLIAQELQKVFPDMVYKNESSDLLSVSYNDLIPVLIKVVQEQHQRINELETQNKTLKKLEIRLSALEALINN